MTAIYCSMHYTWYIFIWHTITNETLSIYKETLWPKTSNGLSLLLMVVFLQKDGKLLLVVINLIVKTRTVMITTEW